jgi:autotransporter-associated beta strand protein
LYNDCNSQLTLHRGWRPVTEVAYRPGHSVRRDGRRPLMCDNIAAVQTLFPLWSSEEPDVRAGHGGTSNLFFDCPIGIFAFAPQVLRQFWRICESILLLPIRPAVLAGVVLFLAAQVANAGPLYFSYLPDTRTDWDDTTMADWATSSGGPYDQLWTSGSDAYFEGTPGTVTVSGTVNSVKSITFNADGYTLSGGTLTLSGSGGVIRTDAGRDSVSSVIAGSVGLTKAGDGTLNLIAANTYSGVTTVSGGVLRLSNVNALPGGIMASGGTSNLNIASGIVELTNGVSGLSRNLGTGASQLQFTGSGGFSAYCNDPSISMTAGVWLNSGATLTWGSGGFVPNGSELMLSSSQSNSGVDFQNPINLGSSLRTVRVADGSAAVDAILSHTISGSGGLNKAGDGTLRISVTNSYTGPTIIAGGVLDLGTAKALPGGIGATGGTSNITLSDGVLQLESGQAFSRSLGTAPSQVQFTDSGGFSAYGSNCSVNLGGTAATVVWGANSFVPANGRLLLGSNSCNATLDFQNPIDFGSSLRIIEVRKGSAAVDAKLSGVLSGAAGFEKSGSGTLQLTASNSYSGPTIVSGGVLGLGNANAIPGGIGTAGGSSNLVLAGGIVELRSDSFYRGLGTGPDQVQFTGSGGFTGAISNASMQDPWIGPSNQTKIVNLGGQSTPVTWGTGGFVPNGATFILGATGASGVLDFQNPINLGDSSRIIQVDGVSPYNSYPPLGYVTLSGGVTGNGAITKSGNGILKLTTANTYSGETQVTGGILQIAHPQGLPGGIGSSGGTSHLSISGGGKVGLDCGDFQRNLGDGPGEVRFSGSGGFVGGAYHMVNFGGASAPVSWDNNPYLPDDFTLYLENVGPDGPMDLQNPLILGAGSRTISTSAGSGDVHARLSGNVSGVGGLKKSGTLVLELTAANTYTGQTEVNCGILRLSNPQALPGGTGTNGGTGNLNFTGSGSSSGWTQSSSGDSSYYSAYGSVGPVVELAAGDFTRCLGTGSSQVQFTGDGGFSAYGANRVVNLGGSSAQVVWGQNSFVPTGSVLHLGSLFSNATIDFQNPIDLGSSVRTVEMSNGTAAVDAKLSGVMSGTGGLYETSGGTLELTAANTYSGPTTVRSGTLRLSNPKALPGGIGATGGTSNLSLQWGVVELASGDFLRGVGTAPNQVQFGLEGGFAAVGANRIVNLGGNSTVLTTSSSSPLTLILSSANADATLDFQNPINFSPFSQTVRVDDGSAPIDAKLSGVLTGTGGLVKTNGGTLQLTAANTYTGETNIRGGALRVSNPQALPGGCATTGGTSNLNFSGGILELASGDFFRGVGTGPSQVQFSALDGGFGAIGADRVVNLGGNSAQLSWGYNKFAPWTLVLGSPNADATVDFQNPVDFGNYDRTVRVDNGSAPIDAELSGALSGAGGGLTKTGTGTLALNANNTYSGPTTISAGTLALGSAGSLTSNLINVGPGATFDVSAVTGGYSLDVGKTLKGGGTVLGNLTVNGIHAPGNSPGIQTVQGNYNMLGQLQMELSGIDTGTGYDQVLLSGPSNYNANLSGTLLLDWTGLSGSSHDTNLWIIKNDTNGTLAGTFGNYANGASLGRHDGRNWLIWYGADAATGNLTDGNDVLVDAMAIPNTLALPSSYAGLRMMRGSTATPGGSAMAVATPGETSGDFSLSSSALTVVPTDGTVPGASTDLVPFVFGWTDTAAMGPKSGCITLSNASNPDDPCNHTLSITGAVLANRNLTVGAIGASGLAARVMVNRTLNTTLATGSDPLLDDDNHATRVNTVASGTVTDGNATVVYQGMPVSQFNGPNQNANLNVAFSKTGAAQGSLDVAPALLSDGEAASVGASVQPALLTYNAAVLADRNLTVAAIGTGHTARVMVNRTLAATTTIASGSDPLLDDDNHATRVNTVAAGNISDGYAAIAYQVAPQPTFNGPNQSANVSVAFAASAQPGLHQNAIDLAPTMLTYGEDPSVGAVVQRVPLDYGVSVLANRRLTVGAIGAAVAPARVVVNCPRTTLLATGSDPVLDGDDGATRVDTVAGGSASDRNRTTVTYQDAPLGTFNGANQSADLSVNFPRLGLHTGSIDVAPNLLADGEAAAVGATVQSATLKYNVNVVRPRSLLVSHRTINFGNVLRGAHVSDNFEVFSSIDVNHATMVNVAPGGAPLGPLTVGQTMVADAGHFSIPISGILDTYTSLSMKGSVPVVTAEAPEVQDTTSYRSLTFRYRANVGLAKFGVPATEFSGSRTALSANVLAGSSMDGLSSMVRPRGTLAADPTLASWVAEPANLKGLYGGVGSEAEIVDSTPLVADTAVSMEWRKRLPGESRSPRSSPSPTLPSEDGWLASDVVKIDGPTNDVTYALQMTFDNRINLALDGPVAGAVANEYPKLYLAEFDTAANKWANAATLGTLGMAADQGVFESLADFFAAHAGVPLADLQGSWGVDPLTSATGLGHSWAIVAGGGSGIFAVDPDPSVVLTSVSDHTFAAVPEPSVITLLSIGVISVLAYTLRRRRV